MVSDRTMYEINGHRAGATTRDHVEREADLFEHSNGLVQVTQLPTIDTGPLLVIADMLDESRISLQSAQQDALNGRGMTRDRKCVARARCAGSPHANIEIHDNSDRTSCGTGGSAEHRDVLKGPYSAYQLNTAPCDVGEARRFALRCYRCSQKDARNPIDPQLFRLPYRRNRNTQGAGSDLTASDLNTLVCLGVGPQMYAVLASRRCGSGNVTFETIQIKDESWRIKGRNAQVATDELCIGTRHPSHGVPRAMPV